MKLAIIGSRGIVDMDIAAYIPENVTEIISGGAKGVDSLVMRYAEEKGIPTKVFLPQYERYGRAAPILRNRQIAEYADEVLAFWDGESKGTLSCIECFKKQNKPVHVVSGKSQKT